MLDTVVLPDRHNDPYAWLMVQAEAVKNRRGIDYAGLSELIQEMADEIMSKATSQMVNLMAHVMKVIHTRNPEVIGHWRSEIVEFQDQIRDAYRPSMRQSIDMDLLWRRACRKVVASFLDHGEPKPDLPKECPFTIEALTEGDILTDILGGLDAEYRTIREE
jgi:hypothetical protein